MALRGGGGTPPTTAAETAALRWRFQRDIFRGDPLRSLVGRGSQGR